MGGMVLETSLQEIVSRFHEQQKIAKSEVNKNSQVLHAPEVILSRNCHSFACNVLYLYRSVSFQKIWQKHFLKWGHVQCPGLVLWSKPSSSSKQFKPLPRWATSSKYWNQVLFFQVPLDHQMIESDHISHCHRTNNRLD